MKKYMLVVAMTMIAGVAHAGRFHFMNYSKNDATFLIRHVSGKSGQCSDIAFTVRPGKAFEQDSHRYDYSIDKAISAGSNSGECCVETLYMTRASGNKVVADRTLLSEVAKKNGTGDICNGFWTITIKENGDVFVDDQQAIFSQKGDY